MLRRDGSGQHTPGAPDATREPAATAAMPWDGCDFGLVALLVATVFAVSWRVRDTHPDDALIYVRYAHNLLAGNGWVYNTGEAVHAATSTLQTLVIAALGACVGNLQ